MQVSFDTAPAFHVKLSPPGFVFAHCCLLTPHIPALLMKSLVSTDVVNVLLDIFDSGAEQIRQKQLGIIPPEQQLEPMGNSSVTLVPGDGPPMSTISESLTITTLKALLELVKQGIEVQRSEGLPENPLVRMCLEGDAIERLRRVLDTTALPPEGYELGSTLFKGLIGASS